MARISIYSQDSDLNIADKVLGTDSTTNTTKNFSLGSIFDLANEIGAVNIFDGSKYKFTTYVPGSQDPLGVINVTTNDTDSITFAAITELYVSVKDAQGNSLGAYLDNTVNDYIKIGPLQDKNVFGIFEVTAIVDYDTAYKKLTVTARGANGSLAANTEYFLSNMGVNSSTAGGGLTDASIVDNLLSILTNKPLSANQGRVIKALIDGKVGVEAGKGLSTNDLTPTLLTKLNGIAEGAEVNVQSDWNAAAGDTAILNKPAIPAAQINSDFNETNTALLSFIQNKPTDITDLSSHAVTELSDVTSAGSGVIISNAERTKLGGIAASAEVNVQSDWDSITGDDFIQNKPTITEPVQSDYNNVDVNSLAHILNKPDLLALGATSTTALAGDTTLLAVGTTAGTALEGNTALLAVGTTAGTALEGSTTVISAAQASAITTNSGKTAFPGFGTTAGTSLEGDTALLGLGTIAGTALAGDTTVISTAQASAITTNSGKTAFPGFGTSGGTALEGDTALLALGTTAGTALAGDTTIISGAQATAITNNTNKVEFPGFGTVTGTALQGDTTLLALGATSTTALAGNTTVISAAQASAITDNTAKVSFPGLGTTAATALAGDTTLLGIGTSSTTALAGNTVIADATNTVTLLGTADEVEITGAAQAISGDMSFTVGLPNSITVTNDVIADNLKPASTIEFTGIEATTPTFDNGIYMSTEDTHDTMHFRYDAQDLSIDHLTQNVPTGILKGGVLSTNTNTTFDIASGQGVVNDLNKDNGNPHPHIQQISWVATTITHTLGNAGTTEQLNTYIYVDINGVIQQQLATPTDNLWRSSIVIGVVAHSANVIRYVRTFPRPGYSNSNTVNDFISAFGALKKSGHDMTPNAGVNLGLDRSAGVTFALGRNYAHDPEDPSTVVDTSKTRVVFHRYSTDTTGGHTVDNNSGAGYDDIDPSKTDDGDGTFTAGGSTTFSVQRMFFFPGSADIVAVYYGRAQYATIAAAELGYLTETFTEADNTAKQAIYLGALIVQENATDLSTAVDAKIINGGIFRNLAGSGGGGIAASALLGDIADVTVTGVADNQIIQYNSATGVWENTNFDSDAVNEGAANLYYTEARVTANTAVTANSGKTSFPGFGTTAGTALAGDTALLGLGVTSTTALAGDTSLLALGTTSTTALAGDTTTITGAQATAITNNSNKDTFPGFGTTNGTALQGDTALLELGTSSTTALAGNTALLALGATAGTALAGNTTVITGAQATAITNNSLKDSFPGFGTTTGTSLEGDTALLALGATSTTALAGNTATISVAQSGAITTNSGKTSFPGFGTTAGTSLEGDTALLALGVTNATALAGDTTTITTVQAQAITDNSGKTSFPGFGTTTGTSLAGDTALLALGTTAGTALVGSTTTISTVQAQAITDNSAKVTFPGFGTTANSALPGNTDLLVLGSTSTTALAGDTTFIDGAGTTNAIPLFQDSDTLTDSPLTVDANSNVTATGTGAFKVPGGINSERPTGSVGMIRYNSQLGSFEGYTNQWDAIGGSQSTVQKNTFTGDGTTVAFTISTAIVDIKNINVFIDGVYQFESTYTVNGAVVTFTTAPPIATDNVQIVHTLANVISFVGTAATVVETAGAATCDFQAADIFNLTIDESTTLTFTNPQLANTKNIVITGNHAVTLPASVREISGGSVTATGITLIQVTCVDAITPVYYATIGTA